LNCPFKQESEQYKLDKATTKDPSLNQLDIM